MLRMWGGGRDMSYGEDTVDRKGWANFAIFLMGVLFMALIIFLVRG